MNKLARKILGTLLSISMLSAIMPSMAMAEEKPAVQATNGYFKLEEGDYVATSPANISGGAGSAYSGGKIISTNTGNPDVLPYIEFKIDVEKAGNYKLWWYGTDKGYEYCSPVSLTLDGTTTINDTKYGSEIWIGSTKTAYHSADVALTVGEHTIRWTVTDKAPSAPSYFVASFDFMMIYPESYTWTPSTTELPVAPAYTDFDEEGYVWLEAESAGKNNGFPQTITEAAFSGTAKATVVNQVNPGEKGYYLDFYVNVPETGEYTLWLQGTDNDNSNAAKAKLLIDGTETATTKITGGNYTQSVANFIYGWRMATVNLTAGKHDIRYMLNSPTPYGYYIALLDVICIAPSDYTWTPSASTRPEAPVVIPGTQSTDGYFWLEPVNVVGTSSANIQEGSGNDAGSAYSGGTTKTTNTGNPDVLPYLEFKIDVKASEAGNYKLYWHGRDMTYEYHSPITLTLDGTTTINHAKAGAETWVQPTGSGTAVRTAYHSADIALAEGVHTIRWTVTDKAPSSPSYFVANFDFMVIYPENYTWTPSISEVPVAPVVIPGTQSTDGYFKLENENVVGTSSANISTLTNTAFSGGKAIETPTNNPSVLPYVEFKIDVKAEEAGNYKLWWYGTDTTDSYCSPVEIKLDGTTTISYAKSGDHTYVNSKRIAYQTGEVALTEGEHTLRWTVTSFAPSYSGYIGILDFILLYPEDYTWTKGIDTLPVPPVPPFTVEKSAWIEAEDAHAKHSKYETVVDAKYSNNKIMYATGNESDKGTEGFWLDFNILADAGAYDIYFRGADGSASSWLSDAVVKVDGQDKELTPVVGCEEWHGSSFATCWVKVENVALTADEHTIRWTCLDPMKDNAAAYKTVLDTIVIVPAGVPFAPVANNIAATKADFELCTLLADYDLSNVKENLTLPNALADGTTVTWISSNAAVSNTGVVTRPTNGEDVTVTLTATAGENSKVFTLTVKNIKPIDIENFDITGNVRPGQTLTATANVTRNVGTAADVNLIIAVYDDEGKMLGADMDTKNVGSTEVPLSISYTIPAEDTDVSYAKVFLWSEFGNLAPLAPFDSLGL